MVNYNKGKIYKIEPLNGEEGDIYIGSTTKEYLSQRMDTHRNNYKRFLKGTGHLTTSFNLFNKYGVDNCKIILLELVNVNSKDELLIKEAYYIKALNCVNKVVPLRTRPEYREDNKDKRKEYLQLNKDKIKEQQTKYREDNKDKIKEQQKIYREDNQDKIKKYREDNKDKLKENGKEYKKQNKDKIKEYQQLNKDKIYEKRRELRKINKDK